MFIRCTKKSNGTKSYYCYQLVESFRTEKGPRQRIVMTLGSSLCLDKQERKQLANRIEEILRGTQVLFDLPDRIETLAQEWADKLARKQLSELGTKTKPANESADYHQVDINSVFHEQARQAGIETIAWHIIRKLGLPSKLSDLGLSERQSQVAIGVIIHRLVNSGSERFTHK